MSQAGIAICKICAHQRIRPKPELFSLADLHNPEVLKSKLEWEQQDQQRKFTEQQRYEEGKPFVYEPFHYPWCAAFTPFDPALIPQMDHALANGEVVLAQQLAGESKARGQNLIERARSGEAEAIWELAESGLATMNPVTGEIAQFYALCDHMNPSGQCPLFSSRTS